MSRLPVPTAIKKARGNPGRRPLPKDEPTAPAVDPCAPPPDELSENAREFWPGLAKRLGKASVLSELDTDLLVQLCEVKALLKQAKAAARGKAVLAEVHGQTVVNRAVSLVLELQEREMLLLREFGMTPVYRTKITKVAAPKTDNPFALLQGGVK